MLSLLVVAVLALAGCPRRPEVKEAVPGALAPLAPGPEVAKPVPPREAPPAVQVPVPKPKEGVPEEVTPPKVEAPPAEAPPPPVAVVPPPVAEELVKKPEAIQEVPVKPEEIGRPEVALKPEAAKPEVSGRPEVPGRPEEAIRPEVALKPEAARPEVPGRPEVPAPAEFPLRDIFFDFDKWVIRGDMRPVLDENVKWLRANPQATITIEGHCDERGTNEYNLALGERRARATKEYLVAAGIEANRISIISFGEERPFVLGHDESAWKWNRRAHFVVTAR